MDDVRTWRKDTRPTLEVMAQFDLDDPDDRAVLSDMLEDQGDPELAGQIALLRSPPPDEELFILDGVVTTARIASEGVDVDAFLEGYLDAAVWVGQAWSEDQSHSAPLDQLGFTRSDIPDDQVAIVRPECEEFCRDNGFRFLGLEEQAGNDYFLESGGWTNAFEEHASRYGRENAKALSVNTHGHGFSLELDGFIADMDGDNPPGLVFRPN